jgi:hypothetical protein
VAWVVTEGVLRVGNNTTFFLILLRISAVGDSGTFIDVTTTLMTSTANLTVTSTTRKHRSRSTHRTGRILCSTTQLILTFASLVVKLLRSRRLADASLILLGCGRSGGRFIATKFRNGCLLQLEISRVKLWLLRGVLSESDIITSIAGREKNSLLGLIFASREKTSPL